MIAVTVDSEAREEVNGAMTEAMGVMAAGIWAREAGALEVRVETGAMMAATVDSEAREAFNVAMMEVMAAGTRAREAGARVEVRRAAPCPLEAEMEVVEAVAVR